MVVLNHQGDVAERRNRRSPVARRCAARRRSRWARRFASAAGSRRREPARFPASRRPAARPRAGRMQPRRRRSSSGSSTPIELQAASVKASPPPSAVRLVTPSRSSGFEREIFINHLSSAPRRRRQVRASDRFVRIVGARRQAIRPLVHGNCGIFTCAWLCVDHSSRRTIGGIERNDRDKGSALGRRQGRRSSRSFRFRRRDRRRTRSSRASMSWRRRSATSATSRCARSRRSPPPTRSWPRTPAFREPCSRRYGIETPLIAYHEHNAAESRPRAPRAARRRAGPGADLRRRHAADLRSRLQARRRSGGGGDSRHRRAWPFRRAGGA